jgi:predicted enzyme related to lactoylglutathione lyase
MADAVSWFDIPVSNIERATKFYSTVLGTGLDVQEAMGTRMAFLPMEPGDVGGALVEGEGFVPSSQGTMVYLNAGQDLAGPLSRVEAAGGQVVLPKTSIGEHGFMAYFIDSEGNKVGLHSRS